MKYVYGIGFATTIGLLVGITLRIYVEPMAAWFAALAIGLVVTPVCIKHMSKEGLKENML